MFDRLGVTDVAWQRDASGRDLGYSGLHAPTDAIAKLALLHLQKGVWDGEQLLAASWVEQASAVHVGTPDEANPDWAQGYGFQFWQMRHGGYRGDGAFGQFALVLPDQDAVVAMTGATLAMQDVLDLVWQHLLPAFGDAPPAGAEPAASAGGDAELAERLSRLALPALPTSSPSADLDTLFAAQPGDPARWAGATFSPAGGRCAEQPTLTGLALTAPGDGPSGGAWQVTLLDGAWPLTAPLGVGEWAISELTLDDDRVLPLAVTGGWADADTLLVDVSFLETPHRLRLSADRCAGTFEGRWATTPLRPDSLSSLCSPRTADG